MEKIIGPLLRQYLLYRLIIPSSLPPVKGSPLFFERLVRIRFLWKMKFSSSGPFFQVGNPRTNGYGDDST